MLGGALLLSSQISSVALADDAVDADMKKLSGTWVVTAVEMGGKRPPPDQMPKMEIIIDGNNLTIKDPGGPKPSTFSIDPSKTPKHLDMNLTRPGEKVTVHCIYSVDADELKLAIPLFPRKGQPPPAEPQEINKRPESFDTKGKHIGMMTAKRKVS